MDVSHLQERPDQAAPRPIVIDTNIVLDLFVFDDAAVVPLREALAAGQLHWIAVPRMRDELERVLAYAQIAPRMAWHGREAAGVLAQWDAHAHLQPPAPRCHAICKDADDQCFIDLAVAHRALLLSKDGYVLRLRKRLARHSGVAVARTLSEALQVSRTFGGA
ncbi:MAG: putative toxin-antitoxin system toxin component, PIN family [Brachymonas sp.]|uniref:PIN domain-containing protein n=1 Tax=Brachymonas sp. M4Q-1 TaxID=3416906 RepID=UPI003CF99212